MTQIAEKLKLFPLNSAKCKKVYDKFFKKGVTPEASMVVVFDTAKNLGEQVQPSFS